MPGVKRESVERGMRGPGIRVGRVLAGAFALVRARSVSSSAAVLTRCAALALPGLLAMSCSQRLPVEQILAGYQEERSYPELTFRSPANETLFPPEIVPCTFAWQDATKADTWLVLIEFPDAPRRLHFASLKREWTPKAPEWEEIKERSHEKRARVTVLGFQRSAPLNLLSRGQIHISTSKDKVGAPLFYREVNLPFLEAVKDPSRIRWRFGTIDSEEPPPVVLEGLPVCGNCHSFSQDGRLLGMDVDYANSKGSYVITAVDKNMPLASSDIMTWDNYRPEDRQKTFGLLSQVSPDGQVVISTVKDKSVFVAKPEMAFSQLFFPIKGILAIYKRNSGAFQSLPGADDPEYVQSNPSWSPDGKYLGICPRKGLRTQEQGGRGQAAPLASRIAPNSCAMESHSCLTSTGYLTTTGKAARRSLWRAHRGTGGATTLPSTHRTANGSYSARRGATCCSSRTASFTSSRRRAGRPGGWRCNTSRMNSWHSWSPNGRWLVFSSKSLSLYTQLFLTHIDEQGQSTPPVLLAHFTAPDRAANIPEFVNTPPGSIVRIQEKFLDDLSHARAAYVLENSGDVDGAIKDTSTALSINPKSVHAHQRLGFLLYNAKRNPKEGLAHTAEALRLDPNDACAHFDLGMALRYEGQPGKAVQHLAKALALMPEGFDRLYKPVDMQCALGDALVANGNVEEAATVLAKTVSLNPKSARAHYLLAVALAAQGLIQEPAEHYSTARSMQPGIDTIPEFHLLMSVNYQKAGRMRAALESARVALEMARAKGYPALIESAKERLGQCGQQAGGE